MAPNRDLIILFTKYPKPGSVKTRLIPALGAQGAADLHTEMTEYVLRWLKEAATVCNTDLEVWYDGASESEMKRFLGDNVDYRHQGEGNLGERMHHAFVDAFARGKEHVIIVGSDCPEVRVETIAGALDRLSNNDVVLGPAKDGGYYLVGMSKECHEIFSNIPWSTDRVFEMTKSKIETAGISLGLLPKMGDVDTEEDLIIFEEVKNQVPV